MKRFFPLGLLIFHFQMGALEETGYWCEATFSLTSFEIKNIDYSDRYRTFLP